MPSHANIRIARGARLKAEADFATWLMMAKLGSFDELPAKAQTFLEHYRERLANEDEKRASSATIAEMTAAYYVEMGGTGAPPEDGEKIPTRTDNVVQLKKAREGRAARPRPPSTASSSIKVRGRDLLIFAVLVVVVVAVNYFMGSFGH